MVDFAAPATVDSLRIPPHSVQAEQCLLGALMLDNATWDQVADRVNEQDFYRREHRLIFQAIVQLANEHQPFDLVTLSETLEQQRALNKVGGLPYLGSLVKDTPSAANIIAYADIVREYAILRSLITVGISIADQGYRPEGRTAIALVDEAERRVFEISDQMNRRRRGFQHIKPLLIDAVDRVESLFDQENPFTGLATGFIDFDKMTSGLQTADLIIVAGRPAMGKCLVGTTRIVDPNSGVLHTLAERITQRHGNVFAMNEHGQFIAYQASHFLDDGIKPVFQITTALGRRISCTLSHPFFTPHGWRSLAQLQVGTAIGVPRYLPVHGHQPLHSTEIITLAHISLNEFAGIPAVIFRLPLIQLALFLHHYLSALHWQFAPIISCRQELPGELQARDVVHLLLRFGIIARITEIPNSSMWELHIYYSESVCLLIEKLGIRCPDKAVFQQLNLEEKQPIEASTHFIWDSIVVIQDLGRQQVYDLTIPGLHNFIADDVCVHNTSYAMNIAEHVAMNTKRPVAVFSMEMTAEALAMRLMSSLGHIDMHNIRTGKLADEEWPRLTTAVSTLSTTRLFIDDSRGLNPTELRARARRLKHEQGDLALIIVDYLQLMEVAGRIENRATEIAIISRALKTLAGELNVPVIALSQLNRSLESRPNKRPLMADLRESGAIEQDADLIIFIYRDEVYNPESPDKGTAEIIISKQRNGPTGTVRLTFLNKYTRFENYVDNVYDTGYSS